MPLSPSALRRLAELGFSTPEQLRVWEMLSEQGEREFDEMLSMYVRAEAEARRLAAKWHPRLAQFAEERRASEPLPDPAGFTLEERTKVAILRREMVRSRNDRFLSATRSPHETTILSTTALGLRAAHEVFGDLQRPMVILTSCEIQRWFAEVYDEPEDAEWWYIRAWWNLHGSLDELLPESERQTACDSLPELREIPANMEPWFVTSGLIWGALAGGETTEMWLWDGRSARYVDIVSCAQF